MMLPEWASSDPQSPNYVEIIEDHRSPDGLLRLLVLDQRGDLSIGFDGYPGHTHGDILSGQSGLPIATAVRRYVDDILLNRAAIAVERVHDKIVNIWVEESPEDAGHFLPSTSRLELRRWSGIRIVFPTE